jgi:hypothetical protein
MDRLPFACLLCLTLAVAPVLAQQPGRIMTVTRSVTLFSGLEAKLDGAIHDRDETALAKLLAPNFEMRNGANPGNPTPRAEWLAGLRAHLPGKLEMTQMAVHDYGNVAAVSFLDTTDHAFVVDVWSKSADGYALSVRYTASASSMPQTKPENPAK